ncbi:MAG: PEP-CTERM sorting domain-containing protein [Terriglobus roseus]|nr:PEP-CTERM sorting domain-containing protein [Terriglobus roseus]
MKLSSALLASALLAVSASAAMADTIGSYAGATAPAGSGYINSPIVYTGMSTTLPASGITAPTASAGTVYSLPTAGIWYGPVGSSSWVGINPQDYPGGSNVEPNGEYFTYYTTFSSVGPAELSLDVLADDTTWVYLNGALVVTPTNLNGAQHCIAGRPTCTYQDLVEIAGVTSGTNYLTFSTEQRNASASGFDFEATTSAVTPEPSSLMLLGSGLSTMAGFAFRRRRVQA